MKSTRIYSFLGLASAIVLSGCAFTAKVKLSYVPAKKSALSELKPMRVSLRVDDQRPGKDPREVGCRSGSLGSKAKVVSTADPCEVVRKALAGELEHAGHRVTDTHADAADATVEVGLQRLFIEDIPHLFDLELVAGVNADITIARPAGKTRLAKHVINGTSRKRGGGAVSGTYEDVLNSAIAEFVRSFSLDPEVIAALQPEP
jgi:uncharacterized lipoprotein YajG